MAEGINTKQRGFNFKVIETGGSQGSGTSFKDLGYSDFDATETYDADDVVIYNGKLYKFNARHSGAWIVTDATPTSVEKLIREKSVEIVDNLESFAADKPLSANQGRVLNERANSLEGIGRFLSLWNGETGLAESTPPQLPYLYDNGCYFRIGALPESGDILMPAGSQYTGEASTTVYDGDLTLETGDLFVYDGATDTWIAQKNQVGGKVQDVKINNVTRLVNGEVNFIGEEWTATLTDGTMVTKKVVLYD